jgi:hypothetical protein
VRALPISFVAGSVLDDGTLRAEVDHPVIGRHRGLDDVAAAQIFRVLGLPWEESLPLQLVGKQRPDDLDWLGGVR